MLPDRLMVNGVKLMSPNLKKISAITPPPPHTYVEVERGLKNGINRLERREKRKKLSDIAFWRNYGIKKEQFQVNEYK